MSSERCDRSWEAEAMEDGRLGASGSAAYARHVVGCTVCRAEVEGLRRLREAFSVLPEPALPELERRRARRALLRAADAQLVGRNQGEARIGWRIPALLALVAASVVAVWWLGRVGDAPRIVATSALPTADIVGAEGAQWSERIDGETRRITVSVGEVSFRVDHVAPKARFVVELPDGDLEVHGTQFTVDVEGGRTRSVVVSEGVVELRVPGFHGRVYAHEAWRAPVASASATPSLSTTAAAPPSGAPSTSPAPPTSHDPSASPSATPPSAGERFAEAMGAFTSADYGRADHLFALFMQDFPRDSRAEDAMYLRAEARLRAGDASGAAAIARAYLGAFPKGFRRPEAERIAGLAPDSPPTPSAPPR